jgi:ribosomal protein S27AE
MQLDYKEQLADARWLKKRNEIIERDNYTCQKCGATSHLNVHHLSYERNRLAWEYPNEKLITLCEQCHAMEHKNTRPYVGEVYAYEHSDYINYMVCYGVNKVKKEVYLVGVDNGGCITTPNFECVSFDVFSSGYIQLYSFWDKSFQDDAYWQEVLVRILIAIYENKVKNYYVNGFVYPKESVLNYAKNAMWDLVNTNMYLLGLFNQILNVD